MFHADHTALQILGHAMIAFLFIFRGLTAMPRFADHAGRLAKKNVPLPEISLAIGFGMMLAGGVSILIDFYAVIGACLLIGFTMLANVLYHDFWNHSKDDWAERNRALYVFCNNTAVMGGLVLVATL
ncbi:MAG: DoxX family membrane protein [Proteobacteria bacterium]|nr:DoxX family membrane protein [Pseudomonadota bacterium]